MSIGIILLAAGSSSRLGQSKQLIKIDREPLLVRSATIALKSKASPVVVVLGFEEQSHRRIIQHLPVTIIHNPDWKKGMGSSIKAGLKGLQLLVQEMEAVIIMVCDQPLLTSEHLNKLIATYRETKSDVVASFYSGAAGTPALFDRSLFEKLLCIPDQSGAKKIIDQSVSGNTIPFDEGTIDLDTHEDYQNFLKIKKPF